ncbi:adenine nucleotide alpha hydrolases-like protein [Clavulina sp. PMI_390]|nr:adenine nucleotide alpha hydrolases-like protein [Clavulina sp. PMI_390]
MHHSAHSSSAATIATKESDPEAPSASSSNLPPPQLTCAASSLPKLRSIYITSDHPFPEIEEFVEESCVRYNLDLVRIGGDIKEALATYLGTSSLSEARASMHLAKHVEQGKTAPGEGIKAIVMGTRKTDPYSGNLDYSVRTDAGWPDVLRIHPIINWTYAEIWQFMLRFNVPYCSLYDEGYTSLGSIYNTWRNPALLVHPHLPPPPSSTSSSPSLPPTLSLAPVKPGEKCDACGVVHSSAPAYRPAHELQDEESERAGRGKVDPTPAYLASRFGLSAGLSLESSGP